jgi:hypothetical protein
MFTYYKKHNTLKSSDACANQPIYREMFGADGVTFDAPYEGGHCIFVQYAESVQPGIIKLFQGRISYKL